MPTALPSVMCNCKMFSPSVCLVATGAGQTGALLSGYELQIFTSFAKLKLSLNFPKVSDSSKSRGWLLIASTEEAHKM